MHHSSPKHHSGIVTDFNRVLDLVEDISSMAKKYRGYAERLKVAQDDGSGAKRSETAR